MRRVLENGEGAEHETQKHACKDRYSLEAIRKDGQKAEIKNKNGGNIAISGPDCHVGTSRSLDEMMILTRLADRVCSATTDAERFGKDYSP